MQRLLPKRQNGDKFFPVIETLHYEKKLTEMPVGTSVLITDPDHDRLTIAQTEFACTIPELERAGIDYIRLNEDLILTIFTANQAFFNDNGFLVKTIEKTRTMEQTSKIYNQNDSIRNFLG